MNTVKKSRLVQFFYNLPGVASTYHFLWAWLGAKQHGNASARIFVIGITGTKGKTTTLELLNAILESAGKRTALLSSLRVKIAEKSEKSRAGNSMPGRAYIQNFLRQAFEAKCPYALIEVTSQGVVQHRHRFVQWNIGALTNLSPEHIEAHGSFENYRKAKLDFLKYVLAKGGKVFLNRGDKNFNFFEAALNRNGAEHAPAQKAISYSREDDWLRNYLPRFKATRAASGGAGAPKFLLSGFNEENIAVAVAIARELGIGDKAIEDALVSFRGVPGRMEFVTAGPYTAIVDYAHTPDSLRAAYEAAKPRPSIEYLNPHLICVLGAAGGGRDKWKRPEFGKIAAEYCDEIILTDEDPYDEDPAAIIREVRSGILGGDPNLANVHEVLDRHEAIQKAVSLMEPGDVVIGTGKGSEESIHIARGKTIPWNEKSAFEAALMEKKRT
ncbi:MAG TPA: UDP-N-acetylmuramyl-tripeptide synthetase [Candidatus Paceibacterota bacterium]|jgi:UDP-N-acetylmuramoyl-L-alanyl-D-glutamate--2,6-diaminopimelate ligase|nr:UDP-N-acetylmuramyl-tripeptide synthetase [Candidatus Paceibacterota bacterium]